MIIIAVWFYNAIENAVQDVLENHFGYSSCNHM